MDRLKAVGYGDRVLAFAELVRPSARLITDRTAVDPESSPLRLGGRPLLPPDADWPRREDGKPLSLIAQISLAQFADLSADRNPHPVDGTLAFFYDAVEQSVWGFSPSDADGWAIVHSSWGAGVLRDFPEDLATGGRFRAIALSPTRELTYPPVESFDVEVISGQAWPERYWPVLGEADEDSTIHRFLGHPDPVQGDMQLECQLASNGIYAGDGKGAQSPDGIRLRPGAAAWRLLLQIDSDEDARMMWGDVGRIYWWIRDADLAAGRWDAAWLVLQCG